MRYRSRRFLGTLLAAVLVGPGASLGQDSIVFDGTFAPDGGAPAGSIPDTSIPCDVCSGLDYRIADTDGKVDGTNLFHSFDQFNIELNDAATFTGPGFIDFVFARVTGGTESEIDGWLRSEIPSADLFLLNPYGTVFHGNAQLDVDGSFYVSSADVMHFEDGFEWPTGVSGGLAVTSMPPSAFGFLSDDPKPIEFDRRGSFSVLGVPPGETLAAVGGDVTVRGFEFAASVPTFIVDGGVVALASVAGPATVDVDDFDVDPFAPGTLGTVTLTDKAIIFVSGETSGRVVIRGGEFLMEDFSLISGDTFGPDEVEAFDAVDIRVTGKAEIDSSQIAVGVFGMGTGGGIHLEGETLELRNSQVFTTASGGDADAPGGGDLIVDFDEVIVESGDGPDSGGVLSAGTEGESPAGLLWVRDAEHVLVRGEGSGLFARTGGAGAGGEILVEARYVDIEDGGVFSSSAAGVGLDAGAAGNITVRGAKHVRIAGGEGLASSIEAQGEAGAGGDIRIETDVLEVTGGGLLSASTEGNNPDNPAGNIDVEARVITLDGVLELPDGDGNPSSISSQTTQGAAAAGNITLTASESLEIRNGAQISVESRTPFSGPTGKIDITAPRVLLSRSQDGIRADSKSANFPAGDIGIQADEVQLDRSSITVAAETSGGNVDIRADEVIGLVGSRITANAAGGVGTTGGNVTLAADRVALLQSEVAANASAGSGGSVVIGAADVIELDLSRITANAAGGDGATGGDVRLVANKVLLDRSEVVANASTGSGGNVSISANRLIDLRSSLIGANVAGGAEARGGNVTLAADDVTLDRSGLFADAQDGVGGVVKVTAKGFFVSGGELQEVEGAGGPGGVFVSGPELLDLAEQGALPESVEELLALGLSDGAFVDVSGGLDEGKFEVRSPTTDVIANLATLSSDFLDVSGLRADECAAREAPSGSLVVRGRDRIPAAPGDRLRVLYLGEL